MFIAKQKRKENIAEYLLYMWQIEDLIRANNCDIDKIEHNIIDKYNVDDNTKKDIRDWYESLIKMMERENVKGKGHLQINKNIIILLSELHLSLLKSPKFPEYGAEFYKTLPYIVELRAKAGDNPGGEIETCFNALYGTLLLKLQHKEISKETSSAVTQIAKFIAKLAALFKQDEQKPLFGDEEEII